MSSLPIDSVLPVLRSALRNHPAAVLQAPPGAGKTTRVPLALLEEAWLAGRKIVMLEPRRLAARAAAGFMARTLGERVGETVGYRVRMDTKVGPRTRIEVVTEGVLTRLLQADPGLEGVGLVVFDEFHERSLHADLGLALTLQTRAVLRADLRLLVMSATLDGVSVAALIGEAADRPAPIVASEGRSFPVDTRYVARTPDRPLEAAVAAVVRRALADDDGDVLVFLPGAAEIRRVEALLTDAGLAPGVYVAPLFGNLSQDAQDRAIEPSPPRMRKVVLATSIAETSLTIEGVRVVVDGGLMRVPRFSPRSGMTRLETVRVTRASADQRRGRAGRIAPGVCYRLWSEHEEQHLAPHGRPEILDADLAPLALELAEAGVADPAELRWLDPPPAAALAQARELLSQLGALDSSGRITGHGREMARLALHPRLAHMLLAAAVLGHGALACDIAALVSERDIFHFDAGAPIDADLRLRLEALHDVARGGSPSTHAYGATMDRGAVHRALAISRDLARAVRLDPRPSTLDPAGLLLAFAYPDRIAQRRVARDDTGPSTGRFLLRNGVGAVFPSPQALAGEPYVSVAELGGPQPEARIYLASPIALEEIEAYFADQIAHEELVSWDAEAGAVRARERERLGALVLRERAITSPDPAAVAAALLGAVAQDGLRDLPWTDGARQLQQRIAFMHRLDPTWPDVSDAALTAALSDWLAPHVYGLTRRDELRRLDLAEILLGMLDWEQRAALDEVAPSHIVVPSGSRIRIDYSDPQSPVLAVRLQELFGLTETPRIGRGRIPLTLHLLSPAHRPVQITTDLAGFWRTAYFDVRKELKGRYPKHYWPDDPLQAVPTRHVRPRN
ncbi:MAG: ATP-dependent helicase HrpB [Gemmatimonadota bacterium]|nr:ATP-dependent helicase HrpB [Gemmatimonadota bacterium]